MIWEFFTVPPHHALSVFFPFWRLCTQLKKQLNSKKRKCWTFRLQCRMRDSGLKSEMVDKYMYERLWLWMFWIPCHATLHFTPMMFDMSIFVNRYTRTQPLKTSKVCVKTKSTAVSLPCQGLVAFRAGRWVLEGFFCLSSIHIVNGQLLFMQLWILYMYAEILVNSWNRVPIVTSSLCKPFHSNLKTSSWERDSCCKNVCKLPNRQHNWKWR